MKLIFKQLFAIGLFFSGMLSVQAEIFLQEGYVRAMPLGVPNSAAYLTLKNMGNRVQLTGVTTNIAHEAQLHTLVEEQGLIKMRQVQNFTLPKNGVLTLSPSGDHIMLLGLHKTLNAGDEVPLKLFFSDGSSQEVTIPVKRMSAGHHHH